MPDNIIHCEISKKKTGKKFSELHKWIDNKSLLKHLGIDHRRHRHYYNIRDEEIILSRWGAEGVIEWLFHIAIDNLETAQKRARKLEISENNYIQIAFGKESGFIYLDFEEVKKQDIIEKFTIGEINKHEIKEQRIKDIMERYGEPNNFATAS